MGGMGKTSLTAHVAKQVADQFDIVIWRSLLNAPPLTDILHDWLQCLSNQQLVQLPEKLDAQLALLFEYLRQQRCLLVLDNAESIMQDGERAGLYRPGYEAYGKLFQYIGERQHQSCLMVTSREQPQETVRLERSTPLVRSLALSGVDAAAGQAILHAQGVDGPSDDMRMLVQRYSGNPLALLLIAETITGLFDGDVASFLHEGTPIFDDIRTVLDQQFIRLSPLEQSILLWLAIEREAVSLQQLSDDFAQPVPKPMLIEALNSLRHHSMLEKVSAGGFTVQNVVIEYLTDRLVSMICHEIETATPRLLHSHALLKANAKEYVRRSQSRLIVQPVAAWLKGRFGATRLEAIVTALLASVHADEQRLASYAGGNMLNILLHMGADLRPYDFSNIAVWQAYCAARCCRRFPLPMPTCLARSSPTASARSPRWVLAPTGRCWLGARRMAKFGCGAWRMGNCMRCCMGIATLSTRRSLARQPQNMDRFWRVVATTP